MVDLADVSKLKVCELKDELKRLNQPTNGLKAALAARLSEALEEVNVAKDTDPKSLPAASGESPPVAVLSDAASSPGGADANTQDNQHTHSAEAANPLEDPPHDQDTAVPGVDATEENPPKEDAAATPKAATVQDPSEADVAASAGTVAGLKDVPVISEKAAEQSASPVAVHTESKLKTIEAAAADGEKSALDSPVVPNTQPAAAKFTKDSATASDGEMAEKFEVEKAMTANDRRPKPISGEGDAKADLAGKEERDPAPASADGETGQGPEAMEEEDGAPEVDFEVDVEEEVEEAAKAAKAAQRERKRKASVPGDARDSIKAARLSSGEGHTTPQSGRPSGGVVPRSGVRIPSPNREPTRALRIDGLMRPFTKSQLEELLRQEGCQLENVWLPTLKTHCYALFQSSDNAETIRQATFGVQWPKGSEKKLTTTFVGEEEALSHINGTYVATPKSAASEPVTAARSSEGLTARLSMESQGAATGDARQEILDRRNQRQAATANQGANEVAKEPPVPELGLDDLFRKTSTEPSLYWLPSPKAAGGSKDAVLPAADPQAAVTSTV